MSETRWKLFNRFALLEFDIKNEQKILSLTSEDIDFNARVSLNRFSNNNTANITLYNLPKNIRNKLIKNIEVRINAGYLTLESENIKDNIDNNINDFGITFLGVIENVKDSCDNTTIKTEIQCSEVNYDYKENKITGTYYKDTPAIEILKDIQKKSSLFFDFDKINLGIPDFKYERGKILGNNLNNIFYRIAADTNSYFYLHNNSVKLIRCFCWLSNRCLRWYGWRSFRMLYRRLQSVWLLNFFCCVKFFLANKLSAICI